MSWGWLTDGNQSADFQETLASVAGAIWTVKAGADSAEILAVFQGLAANDRVIFQGDAYTIDAPLTISVAGVTVDASLATITQTTTMKPVFDILSGGSRTKIVARQLTCSASRYPGVAGDVTFRGERLSHYSTGVYLGADHCDIDINTVDGFYTGVSAYPLATGDTALETEGTRKQGNKVKIGKTVNVDMGILFCGQDGLDHDISGTYGASATSPNPPHLVYATQNRTSVAVTGRGNAYDGTDSCDPGLGQDNVAHAYQYKGVLSGSFERLFARNCKGLISIAEDTSIRVQALIGRDMVGTPAGQVYFQGLGEHDCDIDALLEFAAGESDNRALRGAGTNNRCKLTILADMSSASSDCYATLNGTGFEVDLSVFNAGTAGRRAIRTDTGSGHRITLGSIVNVPFAVGVASGSATDVSVDYDPKRLTLNASGQVFQVTEASTRGSRRTNRKSYTVSGAGTTDIDGALVSHAAITVITGSAFTLRGLLGNGVLVDTELQIEITNSSGGALGAITWTNFSTYVVTPPANGDTATYNFVFDGTNWHQTGRVVTGPAGIVMALRSPAAAVGDSTLIDFDSGRGQVGYDGTLQGTVLGDSTNAKPTRIDGNQIRLSGGLQRKATLVNSSPTTLTLANDVARVDTASVTHTINVPTVASAGAGATLEIIDQAGNASVRNITVARQSTDQFFVTGAAAATSYTINQNYGGVRLVAVAGGWKATAL